MMTFMPIDGSHQRDAKNRIGGMFLTTEELCELTGLARPNAQARWLQDRGFIYQVRADGRLIVSRRHVEQRLGGETDSRSPNMEPNWDAL